jgi:hypothetical protein
VVKQRNLGRQITEIAVGCCANGDQAASDVQIGFELSWSCAVFVPCQHAVEKAGHINIIFAPPATFALGDLTNVYFFRRNTHRVDSFLG